MFPKKAFPFLNSLLFLLFFNLFDLSAQPALWTDIREDDINIAQEDRQTIPEKYRTLRLDLAALKNLLATAPDEPEIVAGEAGLELAFPVPGGGMARFRVWNAPVMHADLAAQFPDIQSFAGRGVDFPGAYVRFDISPNGFHGLMLRTGSGSVYIDPYAKGNTEYYIAYYKKDLLYREGSEFVCHVENDPSAELEFDMHVSERAGDCGNLRTYRLALACTGEYANFHGAFGANKAPALAAMNTSMNRVNGVYEIDCGIRMIIIANNTDIIYTDPASDPYTNGDGNAMLGQNQTTCDGVIGSANYDIGHVFSTGGGGIAQLNSPCSAGNKAKGVTGLPAPVGDMFDIDYVSHEMGHQYGAQHTQYNNCNRSNASAMEPGSASTIMGYAGICPPNVQSNSDDYFHARSLFQIGNFVTGGNGNSCDVPVANGNTAPTVNNVTDKTIPISTPFVLTASASDPNGDALSFCWEQMNAYSNPAQPMPPESTNTTGPMFRSLDPVGSPSRYFPNFTDVLANIDPEWEELPSVGRSMIFRVTARDNHANGGCTAEDDVTITTTASAGPFLVTSPNTNQVYNAGSVQTVTWNVANTTASPVSCANVNILISLDGGDNFSILVTNTPNDGSQSVTMPGIASSQCRVMVQCSNNYFYDVSNADFQLITPLPVELADFSATLQQGVAKLKWTTASEEDNKGFWVERSMDDTRDFQAIGWVEGSGTSTVLRHYSFTDGDIRQGKTYYYRLKQLDFDGATAYSGIRSLTTEPAGHFFIFPNPARQEIQLQVSDNLRDMPAMLRIRSAGGRLMLEQDFQADAPVGVQTLPGGTYRIELTTGGQVFTGMFVKR